MNPSTLKKGDIIRLSTRLGDVSIWSRWSGGTEDDVDDAPHFLMGRVVSGDMVLVLDDGVHGTLNEIHVLHPSGASGYVVSDTGMPGFRWEVVK